MACAVTVMHVSLVLLVGGGSHLAAIGGGRGTLEGKNPSWRTSHFPWKVLLLCMSGNLHLALGRLTAQIAFSADPLCDSCRIVSQYFHWASQTAFFHALVSMSKWPWALMSSLWSRRWRLQAASSTRFLEISGVHHRLDLDVGFDSGMHVVIACWSCWSRASALASVLSLVAQGLARSGVRAMTSSNVGQSVLWCRR